ncbi:FAD-dependent oxidoreductase [Thermodesulforhabdus norvegica]|uniref:NADPH-dependent glutamate synthase beta chain n=1 Tax=Thermodesulforhabdus norvegica TaxID=39841 RepID=A0A1I4SJ95_9BACT|nr:FAD-dependent oxidoreductase [Thermodesulforhabdus norvegica]SFM64343.1 NADPH-dependent glutamate synthase beta chain [Thermodesulforhabdus norvegica]
MAEERVRVAVIGGGIAGIQAALDLAEAGYHVYLIERDISIGGNMARLDKTFPTNDCSTCMLSPKLLEVGAHPNVEILTRCEVIRLEGKPGNFTLTVRKYPRFVLEDRCTACGECSKVCPVELPADFNLGLNSRRAIYRHYPQAVPSAFAIDKAGIAPCRAACPAGISVQGYLALIGKRRYEEALRLIKKDNPFAAVCGRVCHHPCEKACYRGEVDEPIAIEALKRFVADLDLFSENPYIPERKSDRKERVAIIGSGPAGLTAAYYLAVEGYRVSVFEAMDRPGGLMTYGIPGFRLPRRVVEKEIEIIMKLGIDLQTGKVWGKDFTIGSLKEKGFDAVIIATGAQKPLNLNVPGENLKGVIPAIGFLRVFHRLEGKIDFDPGKRVAVIGGGNVAFDVARVARRLGASEVTVLYRRSEAELPATPEEVTNALEEGVSIRYLTGIVGIEGHNGKVSGVRCIKMSLGPPDESGRRRPIPVEGEFFTVPADTVFVAIGQRTDTSPFELESPEYRPALSRWGTVIVDPITYETSVPGVFAAGDVVLGPSSVVQAVGTGKEAAVSVDRFIRGVDLRAGRKRNLSVAEKPSSARIPGSSTTKRLVLPRIPAGERIKGFDEVTGSPSETDVLAEAGRCLNCGICSECHRCEDVCLAGAVDPDMAVEERKLSVGGIVVATGYKTFDASVKPEYGYGRYANVVTSLEYERLLAASGPTGGQIVRPGDGKAPRRIAWIQCVGSRDRAIGREYCSAVCCMYAIKQALITKEHHPEVETAIFFIDIRAVGKGFESYYERARGQGVRFIRSAVSRIIETPEDRCLEITYADDTENPANPSVKTEKFDLVVLSVGLEPNHKDSGSRLDLPLDGYGFVNTDPLSPTTLPEFPGVTVCGVSEAPKDIPESVVQASSAAGGLMELLGAPAVDYSEEGGTLFSSIPLDPPRIGVFICHCGTNIAGVVDVKAVAEYAGRLPGVVHATDLLFACAGDGTRHIAETIARKAINRVVVASCSPRTHEPLFQKALASAGLNPYLLEMANIRDQCSWVHSDDPGGATRKAMDLVRMAVAKTHYLEPIREIRIPIAQKVLVVGGGPSGMTAALAVAKAGFEVVLVEEKSHLGGYAVDRLFFHPSGISIRDVLKRLEEEVTGHEKITLCLSTRVLRSEGHPGRFLTTLGKVDDSGKVYERITVEHGAVIIATGAREYEGSEYLRGTHPGVVTQGEFQRMLFEEDQEVLNEIKHIVMIQCVGSRDEAHPYCSRVCCTTAVSNALRFKEICPNVHVSILYRDIRTFGMRELVYLKAREKGVRFFRYDLHNGKPEVVPGEKGLKVRVFDESLGENIELMADLVVLSTGIEPLESNREMASLFKVGLDQDGFFLEAHPKLRPVDTATTGIYVAGTAQGPKFLEECTDQAKASAAKAVVFLNRRYLITGGRIAVVDPKRCSRCLTCVRVCPYGAPSIRANGTYSAQIDPAICQGCGICSAECPAKAIDLRCFTDLQIKAKISAMAAA